MYSVQTVVNLLVMLCTIIHLMPVSVMLALDSEDNSISCDTDRDCPQTMFCFNDLCYQCFNCSKVFRHNWLRCAKDPSNCGKCLPGYKEDSYRTSHYYWCVEDLSIFEARKVDSPEDSRFKFNFPWMGSFIIICLSVLGFASYLCYNAKKRHTLWTADVRANYQFSNPPPPYKEEDIQISDHGNSPSCSFQLQVTGNSEGDQQKAVPFLYIESLRTENSNGTIQCVQTSPALNSVAETAFTAVNLDIHDETTVPSCWTPGASYGEGVTEYKNDDESPAPKKKKSNQGHEVETEDKKKESQ